MIQLEMETTEVEPTEYSASEEAYKKVKKSVEGTGKRRKAIRRKPSTSINKEIEMKTYVAQYNYTTDQYKWTASVLFKAGSQEEAEGLAHEKIQEKRGQGAYELMYVREA